MVIASTAGEMSVTPTAGADRPGEGPAVPVDAAALLAVAADPNRLAILSLLTTGTCCVCEVQQLVPLPSNLLSYHLKVLREAGLITSVKRGRWVDYTLAPDALERLHAAIPTPPGPAPSQPGRGPAERCPQ